MCSHTSLPDFLGALLESSVVRTIYSICGAEASLVGGVLRDALLERHAADIDVVVSGDGGGIAERLAVALDARLVHLGGERFASYRLVSAERIVDLWDRRGQSLEDDLRRRDLTINSMALELGSERLIDPFGGRRDIHEHRLKATTAKSFSEDPLRVLRLVRFRVSLDFDIEPKTLELARQSASEISALAIERIRTEVELLIRHPQRVEAVRLLSSLAISPSLWESANQPPVERDLCESLARLESWSEEIGRSAADLAPEIDTYLTSMAVLFAAANPARADGIAESQATEAVRESQLLTRRERRLVERLVHLSSVPYSESEARWFLHRWGDRWLDAIAVWGACSEPAVGPGERLRRLSRLAGLAREHGADIFEPAPLLTGDEVGQRLSIGPGPEVGRCLDALRRLQIQGRMGTRDEALAFVDDRKTGEES